jgi:hypothetical protein
MGQALVGVNRTYRRTLCSGNAHFYSGVRNDIGRDAVSFDQNLPDTVRTCLSIKWTHRSHKHEAEAYKSFHNAP